MEVWRCKLASGGSGMFRTWRVPGVLEVKVSEVREVEDFPRLDGYFPSKALVGVVLGRGLQEVL